MYTYIRFYIALFRIQSLLWIVIGLHVCVCVRVKFKFRLKEKLTNLCIYYMRISRNVSKLWCVYAGQFSKFGLRLTQQGRKIKSICGILGSTLMWQEGVALFSWSNGVWSLYLINLNKVNLIFGVRNYITCVKSSIRLG